MPKGADINLRSTSVFTLESATRAVVARLGAENVAASPAELVLETGRCVVGAAEGCDLLLAHGTVSRRHLEVTVLPDGVSVRDLGSTNGVYHQGNRIQEMVLRGDATLRLGQATLSIELDQKRLSQPPSVAEYGGLLTQSASMKRLLATLRRLERSLINVLLVGETGTGKELLARAIHAHSSVKSGPFVAVNCGALPRDLIHSELFGHRRGAFTGAFESRRGSFELACGGTLFLDEVGELAESAQPVLLRALQERMITPVGDPSPRPVSVRVVAATNRRLYDDVQRGKFREDLFYRLNGVCLELPPLRARSEDIELLARHFALRGGIDGLAPGLVHELAARSWPGNVRELEQAISAYAVLEQLPTLPRAARQSALEAPDIDKPYEELKRDALEQFQRSYLRALLARTRGNLSAAARLSGLERSYLGKLVRRSAGTPNSNGWNEDL